MSQTAKIGKANTVIVPQPDGALSITLYQTEILRYWTKDRKVRIDTGGYYTVTTRTRLNQAFNEWGLPLSVSFSKKDGNVVTEHVGDERVAHQFSRDHLCYVTF